jgi:hypothetical protein
LDARGIKRKQYDDEPGNWQHGHRREDRLAVGRALYHLKRLSIELAGIDPTPRKRGREVISVHRSDVLEMPETREEHDAEGRQVLVWAKVRLGPWARALGIHQTGLLAQRVLAYDPYRETIEKRLGKYLVLHFRINARQGAEPLRRHVSTLLEAVDLDVDKANPQRTRDRLEKALKKLQADNIICGWRYAPEPNLPARGWVPTWERTTVELVPPAVVLDQYGKLSSPRPALAARRRRR